MLLAAGGKGKSMTDVIRLDVRGLKCPLPVLKARKTLSRVQVGGVIELISDDPLSVIDVPHFCNESGHHLMEKRDYEGGHLFLIRKS